MPPTVKILFLVTLLNANIWCYEHQKYWQGALPLSFSTLNDAAKPRLEFGSGIGVDAWILSQKQWLFGVGGGFYASVPFKTGNASVRATPYTAYVEPRINIGYVIEGNFISIVPLLALKMHLGIAHYSRRVHKSFSRNTDFLLALGPTLGSAYWIKNWGIIISYSPLYGTKGFRQQFDLSVALRMPLLS